MTQSGPLPVHGKAGSLPIQFQHVAALRSSVMRPRGQGPIRDDFARRRCRDFDIDQCRIAHTRAASDFVIFLAASILEYRLAHEFDITSKSVCDTDR
jgi:hypothetical protein